MLMTPSRTVLAATPALSGCAASTAWDKPPLTFLSSATMVIVSTFFSVFGIFSLKIDESLIKIKIHIILHSFFEKRKLFFDPGGYQSGQLGQTVNLLTYVFVGSNPAPPTIAL